MRAVSKNTVARVSCGGSNVPLGTYQLDVTSVDDMYPSVAWAHTHPIFGATLHAIYGLRWMETVSQSVTVTAQVELKVDEFKPLVCTSPYHECPHVGLFVFAAHRALQSFP
jgi:hypothetical protein